MARKLHFVLAVIGIKPVECGACALNCPVNALTVNADFGYASGMINEWMQSLRSRFLKGVGAVEPRFYT